MTDERPYDWLMSGAARDADPFDAHVAASILALALQEGDLCAQCGLSAAGLAELAETLFPRRQLALLAKAHGAAHAREVEEESLCELLCQNASPDSTLAGLFAAMIARRAMEPDHLWQDLGLRNREELSDLLTRHFGPLAGRNTDNMKWKRFFYRTICESEGFVLCPVPVCTECRDYDMCFGPEAGEPRLSKTVEPSEEPFLEPGQRWSA